MFCFPICCCKTASPYVLCNLTAVLLYASPVYHCTMQAVYEDVLGHVQCVRQVQAQLEAVLPVQASSFELEADAQFRAASLLQLEADAWSNLPVGFVARRV